MRNILPDMSIESFSAKNGRDFGIEQALLSADICALFSYMDKSQGRVTKVLSVCMDRQPDADDPRFHLVKNWSFLQQICL